MIFGETQLGAPDDLVNRRKKKMDSSIHLHSTHSFPFEVYINHEPDHRVILSYHLFCLSDSFLWKEIYLRRETWTDCLDLCVCLDECSVQSWMEMKREREK